MPILKPQRWPRGSGCEDSCLPGFLSGSVLISLRSRIAENLLPVSRAIYKTTVKHRHQLRVARQKVFVRARPFLSALPAALCQANHRRAAARLELKCSPRTLGADVGKLVRGECSHDQFLLRNEA